MRAHGVHLFVHSHLAVLQHYRIFNDLCKLTFSRCSADIVLQVWVRAVTDNETN